MYLKQSDLFWGMSQDTIQKITDKAIKKEYEPDEVIFRAEDRADYFFVLINGKVRMELPGSGHKIYNSVQRGEIFGWSALLDRDEYSATVVCEEPTMTLSFHKENVQKLLEQDAVCSSNFYKQLARALGDRLLRTYDLLE
ncbi:MAG: cyclic nucleotide-binding domain-containing protein [Desulfocapsaceae bacterium]|nr:cyclic nucleotide-binding domain-containing protein [Desulfocapsaceae bacterium]